MFLFFLILLTDLASTVSITSSEGLILSLKNLHNGGWDV